MPGSRTGGVDRPNTGLTNRELLQLIGMVADLGKPEGETDPAQVTMDMFLSKMAREGISPRGMDDLLIHTDRNPVFEQRKAQFFAEMAGDDA